MPREPLELSEVLERLRAHEGVTSVRILPGRPAVVVVQIGERPTHWIGATAEAALRHADEVLARAVVVQERPGGAVRQEEDLW